MRAISKRIVAAAVMLTPLGALAQSAPPSKHVLGLYWDAKENSANDDFERTFRAALRYAVAGSVEYYSEYLDSERFPGENQSEALRDYIQRKYARRPIDVVVTNAIPSLDFLFKYRGELFPRTPIVFSSTSRPSAAQLKTGAGATGIIYVTSYRKTLDLALKLHPATEHVYIVSGATPSGDSWETMARNDLQGFQTSAEITYLTDLPLDGLTARLRTLPERSIVLYVWQRLRDRQGVLLESRDLLSLVAPLIPVPVYGMSFANIGHGIVGGYVWTMETQAAKAAEVTSKVLSGTRPQDIPVEDTPVVPMFDWRELQRWGISEDRLPADSVIRFRELTMWQQYKRRIVVAAGVFVLQALLIGALLVERHRSRQRAAALARAQRVLQESEERFRNMADTAPVMIWVSSPDKLCTFFNKGWLTFTGRALEQELGDGWTERLHPADLDRCTATYSSSFDARVPYQMEYRLRRMDGEYRSLLSAGVPRFQQDGVFAGYIGSCVDITDLKRAQERALAGQKLESMGLLASGVAHDFNNLLGGILSSAELALAEPADRAAYEEELQRIKAAAIGGAQIVRELMILGGRDNPAVEPVDCRRLLREMLQVLKVSISKHATLKTEIAERLPMVRGNPAQLKQLIMNLVINASQAIGERKGEIGISVAPAPEGNYLQLEVADTGSGMTDDTKAKIFDPFFTTKSAGRGLGLAVVQGVVRTHGGTIQVVSAHGSGTTFQVLLPCMAKDETASLDFPANGLPAASGAAAGTILIVEDEDALRIAVSKMLRKKGFSVIEAGDGDAGVDRFRSDGSRIGVVVLDMTLPGRSGREVLAELQRIRPGVKVIITSAHGREHVRDSLDGLQPWRYVQKPYQAAELATLLRECLTAGQASATA